MFKIKIMFFSILIIASQVHALETGDAAPGFLARDREGKTIELSSYLGDRNVLLVFSRYIGCSWCQMFIIDLHHNREKIKGTGAEVIIISNSTKDVMEGYNPPEDFSFILIPDREMRLYELYGLKMEKRGYTGNVIWQSIRFLGYLVDYDWVKGGLEGEHYQPPACMIIGKDGRIKYIHIGKDVADNPRIELIVEELRKLK